jgi:hypothetical protein
MPMICDCDFDGRARIFLMLRAQGVTYRVIGLAAGICAERVREVVNMKTRRHHNNRGDRQVRTGKTRDQVARIGRRLGIPVARTNRLATLIEQTGFEDNADIKGFLSELEAAIPDVGRK